MMSSSLFSRLILRRRCVARMWIKSNTC